MTQHDRSQNTSKESNSWSLDPETCAPHPDELLRALNNQTRRQLLHLLTQQPTTSVETLVEMVHSLDHSGSTPIRAQEREQLASSLDHVHLPLLVDVGLIEYDRSTGSVELTPLSEPVEELIEFSRQYEISHARQRQ